MDFDPNGRPPSIPADEWLNIFALVTYVPDPLRRFLDDLRRELAPHDNPHAHVSVLPPRPLGVNWRTASEQARGLIESWAPFEIEVTDVRVFPITDVLYLEIGAGASELRRMHAAMNDGTLFFEEPFAYHPHITLAQEVPHDTVTELREVARRRWDDYRGPRGFRAEHVVFVQNTLHNRWIDLDQYSLGAVTVR